MSAAEKVVNVNEKYVDFDQVLIKVIASGKNRHRMICEDLEIQQKALPLTGGKTPLFRVIDGRLQALSKRGVLKFTSSLGWRVMNV